MILSCNSQDRDYDFLSSIELLIVDNADVLMMQNWEHMASILEHMHMQPKKSHETDFSRVRYSFLDGHARFYRQTLVFSRIPAPAINALFNKHCHNYAGKCQIDLLASARYQTGTICHIAYPLAQVFHRVECDSPLELPNARFQFFVDKVTHLSSRESSSLFLFNLILHSIILSTFVKILPRFRDEMMSHTLIFISSYFDFVRIRNYFKKNDVNSMNISEYSDNKSIDRARYLFYHGKVHFLLLTERFHFYKRYKLRGISHLIFYDLPHYAEYYSNFCNYLPDPKRFKNGALENFSSTVLYSKFDAQRLCAVVGRNRATHMLNSDKSVHMFMIDAS